MEKLIYSFKDYKKYLEHQLHAPGKQRTGRKSKLANAIGCHTAYVSQVLNGDAHFNLEQAERINTFLGHNKREGNFFFLLVQIARAGTTTLKAHFSEQVDAAIDEQFDLKKRLTFQKTLSREDQAVYYSAWPYAAIHVLISLPGLKEKEDFARYLNLPEEKIAEVLSFLMSVGLIAKKGSHYVIGTTSLHLEHDSPMISKHHTNWRIQAIQNFDQKSSKDLHYSSVITAGREDGPKIKTILVQAIEDIRAIVRAAKDEEGFCYTMDFFGLKKSKEP